MTNALLDAPGPAVRPAPERRGPARLHVADVPVVRILALLVGVSAAIPLGYLVIRVWELGWTETWEIATSERTVTVLIDTVVLAVAVTLAALVISLPLAWLTTRTPIGMKAWSLPQSSEH